MRWGATADEWSWFDLMLGLTADLLPVVSNPEAKISPDSRMKGLGKTPSLYNRKGEVAGIKDWTDRQTTPQQIEKWSREGDYGICVQTRVVRAFDCDVPDEDKAFLICRDFLDALNLTDLPTRYREGTGKQLLAFAMPGDFRKRSFKVEGGLVEFLANGQQFIAVGAHFKGDGTPSGTRYTWGDSLPSRFPVIPPEVFEKAWAFVVERHAIEPERRARDRQGSGGEELGEDDVAAHLEATWPTFGTDGGKLYVECPWKTGHSGDSGETEAAWLLAGTEGYAQGHFACLHASCSGRTDAEFFKAVGHKPAKASDFAALAVSGDPVALYLEAAQGVADPPAPASTRLKATAPHPEGRAVLPLPGFERSKQGVILATIGNVAKAAVSPQACHRRLRYDTFRAELVIASVDAEDWRPFEDADAVDMRIALAEIGFEPVGKELMRDAITRAARDQRFDTAIHWLNEIAPAWDGVERIARFYPDYFATDDSPYTQACGLYVWTAHAGRVLDPGCQADMVPVLVGEEGLRKSSGVAAISPAEDFFAKIDLELKDADLSRKLRGLLVGELDELKGLAGRDSEAIKAWVTKRFERWTPKYQEYDARFPRRLLMHGTANKHDFMSEETGMRRWLPMFVRGLVDVDRIVADRLQLWAEGRERFKAEGVLFEDAERLAKAEHGQFRAHDVWEGPVGRWLDNAETDGIAPRYARNGVTVEAVLTMALGFEAGRVGKREEMRAGAVLKALGMERVQRRVDGRNIRVWADANEDLA